jgi:alkylation response protein AidB-like acyl-CoA dehydrogenase
MDFYWTDEQRAFRQTVRDFLATHLPEELTANLQEGEAVRDETWDENVRSFDRGMVERGWQVFGLPEEYGGKPLTAMNRR